MLGITSKVMLIVRTWLVLCYHIHCLRNYSLQLHLLKKNVFECETFGGETMTNPSFSSFPKYFFLHKTLLLFFQFLQRCPLKHFVFRRSRDFSLFTKLLHCLWMHFANIPDPHYGSLMCLLWAQSIVLEGLGMCNSLHELGSQWLGQGNCFDYLIQLLLQLA